MIPPEPPHRASSRTGCAQKVLLQLASVADPYLHANVAAGLGPVPPVAPAGRLAPRRSPPPRQCRCALPRPPAVADRCRASPVNGDKGRDCRIFLGGGLRRAVVAEEGRAGCGGMFRRRSRLLPGLRPSTVIREGGKNKGALPGSFSTPLFSAKDYPFSTLRAGGGKRNRYRVPRAEPLIFTPDALSFLAIPSFVTVFRQRPENSRPA